MIVPKKSLGQHWLKDEPTLEAICQAADIENTNIILEIGPGLGDMTKQLIKRSGQVIAVEFDSFLAASLSAQINADNLEVVEQDILKFDLTTMPVNYKVVANIPYYLTSSLLRVLSESTNPPVKIVLLIQKEVAERVAAGPGDMSLLAVSVQLYYEPALGPVVPAELFEPPPKVDSRVVILDLRAKPLFDDLDTKKFFRIVKAGFSGRRKKLRGSLSAGLNISKEQADQLLKSASIDGDLRAQNLSLSDWYSIYKEVK